MQMRSRFSAPLKDAENSDGASLRSFRFRLLRKAIPKTPKEGYFMTKIAILGFGVVGGGVADVLMKNADTIAKKAGGAVDIKYILDLREFPDHPLGSRVVHDIRVILDDPEVTVVAEMMGGAHPAFDYSLACLNAGKSVVTSNKQVVSTFGTELLDAARANGVRYLFEASVGGGIPVIHPISQCLAANSIREIDGILNGTTNYILTKMFRAGMSFDDALREAQEKGYAERDPRADVEGIDTCRKIAILCALAYGQLFSPDDISTKGITDISADDVRAAECWGGVIKLIARTGLTDPDDPASGIFAQVCPCVVPHDNPISGVDDVYNAITVCGNAVGDVMFYGRGAGNLPTASAVVADILDIIIHKDGAPEPPVWVQAEKTRLCAASVLPTRYLVRIKTERNIEAEAVSAGCEWIPSEGCPAFVTPALREDALSALLAEFGEAISVIPVLERP